MFDSDSPVIDRRDYGALINVVRAAQNRNDYELAAFTLAIIVHATPWRKAARDRKIDLCVVKPALPSVRVTFLFLLRSDFQNSAAETFGWVRFPPYLFNSDIAAGLSYEAMQKEASAVKTVASDEFDAFKRDHPRGMMPGTLIHPEGCIDVIKQNLGLATPDIFSKILEKEIGAKCLERFTTPHRFPF